MEERKTRGGVKYPRKKEKEKKNSVSQKIEFRKRPKVDHNDMNILVELRPVSHLDCNSHLLISSI